MGRSGLRSEGCDLEYYEENRMIAPLSKVHSEAPQGLWLRQGWVRGSYPRGGQNHPHRQAHNDFFSPESETYVGMP